MFFCLRFWILCLLHLKAGKGAGGHAFGLLGPHLIYYVRTHSDDDEDDGDDDDKEDDAKDYNDDNGDGDIDDQAKPKLLEPWNQVPTKWRDREEIGREREECYLDDDEDDNGGPDAIYYARRLVSSSSNTSPLG